MVISELDMQQAEKRMQAKAVTRVIRARYDRARGMIVVALSSGVEVAFPPKMTQRLTNATATQLSTIEITPSGLGLHWPRLDADMYVPTLLRGVLGSRSWMAQQLGAAGGRVRSEAKAAAAKANGQKGGRPRKMA